MMVKLEVTDDQITKAFDGFTLGSRDPKLLLAHGLLKIQAGYRDGHTITCIMKDLKLVSDTGKVRNCGKRFMLEVLGEKLKLAELNK